MSQNLKSRLARIRESAAGGAALAREGKPAKGAAPAAPLPGWTELEPWLFCRTRDYELPPGSASVRFRMGAFSRRWAGAELGAEGLAFFDLETTGLSGGSGVVAFLAGIGRIADGDRLRVRQYFLADFPGEPAFVAAVKAELERAEAWSTYNGSSFDLPLMRVRCAMNGERPPESRPHADALYPSRRLWRLALPDCSLSTVERLVLGLDRGPDIPGSEIPEAYFRYLREGPHPDLDLALDHNASDVHSLALVSLLVAEAASGATVPFADGLGAAELQLRVDPRLAERGLLELARAGERRAALMLMRLYWKEGRREERLALAPYLGNDAAGALAKSRYHERSLGDAAGALRWARVAVEDPALPAGGTLARRIGLRIRRLEALSGR